jgi:sulfate transport system permease protein
LPLHVEVLYGEYMTQAAFAVASLLTVLAVITLIVKTVVERHLSAKGREDVAPAVAA